MEGRKMKATKVLEAIVLSILLLVTVFTAAVAQKRLISGVYGTNEETSRRVRSQPAEKSGRQGKKDRPKEELSATQWVEVVRAAEGLLGLSGPKNSAAIGLATKTK